MYNWSTTNNILIQTRGMLNDIPNAVVLISYQREAFGVPGALRVFISTDTGISTQKIPDTDTRRWSIDLFFRQSKNELGLDKYQIRSKQELRRYWFIKNGASLEAVLDLAG